MATATDVQRLRSETGAGVMDSKKALEAAKGDFEKAKAIAMQVAAMSPKHVSWELLKDDEIKALLEEHGDEKTAKAAAVLMHQPYIKEQSKTIGDLVTALAAQTGENIKVRRFVRFEVGEGLEKKSDDFVEEVKRQAGQA